MAMRSGKAKASQWPTEAPRVSLGRPTSETACRCQIAGQTARVLGALGAIATRTPVEPLGEIDGVAAEAALGQRNGEIGGDRAIAGPRGVDQHARQPRRQRERADRAALVGDAAVGVERAERGEQRARLREARRGAEDRENSTARGRRRPTARGRARSPKRSAARISGGAKGGRPPVAASSHSR